MFYTTTHAIVVLQQTHMLWRTPLLGFWLDWFMTDSPHTAACTGFTNTLRCQQRKEIWVQNTKHNIKVLDKHEKQLCLDISVLNKIIHYPKAWEGVRYIVQVKVSYCIDQVITLLELRKDFPEDSMNTAKMHTFKEILLLNTTAH